MTAPLEHNLPFDPTYGFDREALLRVGAPAGPEDFAGFWRQTYAQTRSGPLNLVRRPVPSPDPQFSWEEVEFDSLDGFRVGGWLTVPHDARVTCGIVVSHGYGGRGAPEVPVPGLAAAMIFPCARGMNRSARPGLPDTSDRHVIHGIESRDTYIHRGCVADLWAAASALIEAVPQAAEKLHYIGSSFGGGIGALALPWEPRWKKAYLHVPSFGNHPLRLTLPCFGSGEAVRNYHRTHPRVMDVLQYFDSATAARHVGIPTLVAPALFDPAVPPPGQFAVYNGLAGPKELFALRAGHWGYPEERDEYGRLAARLADWFSSP
jgi:cephalosporin-C deacetylase